MSFGVNGSGMNLGISASGGKSTPNQPASVSPEIASKGSIHTEWQPDLGFIPGFMSAVLTGEINPIKVAIQHYRETPDELVENFATGAVIAVAGAVVLAHPSIISFVFLSACGGGGEETEIAKTDNVSPPPGEDDSKSKQGSSVSTNTTPVASTSVDKTQTDAGPSLPAVELIDPTFSSEVLDFNVVDSQVILTFAKDPYTYVNLNNIQVSNVAQFAEGSWTISLTALSNAFNLNSNIPIKFTGEGASESQAFNLDMNQVLESLFAQVGLPLGDGYQYEASHLSIILDQLKLDNPYQLVGTGATLQDIVSNTGSAKKALTMPYTFAGLSTTLFDMLSSSAEAAPVADEYAQHMLVDFHQERTIKLAPGNKVFDVEKDASNDVQVGFLKSPFTQVRVNNSEVMATPATFEAYRNGIIYLPASVFIKDIFDGDFDQIELSASHAYGNKATTPYLIDSRAIVRQTLKLLGEIILPDELVLIATDESLLEYIVNHSENYTGGTVTREFLDNLAGTLNSADQVTTTADSVVAETTETPSLFTIFRRTAPTDDQYYSRAMASVVNDPIPTVGSLSKANLSKEQYENIILAGMPLGGISLILTGLIDFSYLTENGYFNIFDAVPDNDLSLIFDKVERSRLTEEHYAVFTVRVGRISFAASFEIDFKALRGNHYFNTWSAVLSRSPHIPIGRSIDTAKITAEQYKQLLLIKGVAVDLIIAGQIEELALPQDGISYYEVAKVAADENTAVKNFFNQRQLSNSLVAVLANLDVRKTADIISWGINLDEAVSQDLPVLDQAKSYLKGSDTTMLVVAESYLKDSNSEEAMIKAATNLMLVAGEINSTNIDEAGNYHGDKKADILGLAMSEAAYQRNLTILNSLVNQGGNINYKLPKEGFYYNQTPLVVATSQGEAYLTAITALFGTPTPGVCTDKTIGAWDTRLVAASLNPKAKAEVLAYLTENYDNLLALYLELDNAGRGYIKDPSQGNQKVSEGTSFWMLIMSAMASINPDQAVKYQTDFDIVNSASENMVALAAAQGNTGVNPAWKIKIVDGVAMPEADQWGATVNSASDADLDWISSLISAQKLVVAGTWEDRGYTQKIRNLIKSGTFGSKSLFVDINGVSILKPSEDWDGLYFTDYNSPATYKKIQEFVETFGMGDAEHSDAEYIGFWDKATEDGMYFYQEVHKQTDEFSGIVQIESGEVARQLIIIPTSKEYYDGVRSMWRISSYIISQAETESQGIFASSAYKAGKDKTFTFSKELDDAMYLAQSIHDGDWEKASAVLPRLTGNTLDKSKYFEQTLVMLGLITAAFPSQVHLYCEQ